MNLPEMLELVAINYPEQYKKSLLEKSASDNEMLKLIQNGITPKIRELLGNNASHYKIDSSVGSGHFSKMPWIAVVDKRITTSTQDGIYLVYLFSSDSKRIYLSLNQDIKYLGSKKNKQEIIELTGKLKERYKSNNPSVIDTMDLTGSNSTGKSYEHTNIYAIEYIVEKMPTQHEMLADLKSFLNEYGVLVEDCVNNGGLEPFYSSVEDKLLMPNECTQFKYLLNRFIKQANINIKNQEDRSPSIGEDGFEKNNFHYVSQYQMDVLNIDGLEFHVHLKTGSSYGPRNGTGRTKAPYLDYRISGNRWINIRVSFVDYEAETIEVVIWHKMDSRDESTNIFAQIDELDLFSDLEPNDKLKKLYYNYISYSKGKVSDISVKAQELVEKLKASYNIILRGAPGTGKTYLSQQIAALMISEGDTDDIDKLSDSQQQQLGFVQFHPSYDYTDFVEGLRPTKSTNGIGFALEPGVFKEFVTRADNSRKNELLKKEVDNFDKTWEKFVERMEAKQEITVAPMNTYYPSESWKSAGGIMRVTEKGYRLYMNKDQLYKVYRGQKGVPKGGHDSFRRKVIQYMKDELGLLDYREGENITSNAYVFIIDEINRGEISKIFGELFFSVDPGYRGEKGGVFTQYSNLHEDSEGKFYIPKNVYIIGTMNDIDRSVDTFDFAMRRRFTFLEVTAEESAENMKLKGSIKKQMVRLNSAIVEKGGLTQDYQIGASYFKDLDSPETDVTNAPLWDTKLFPLLKDYFRGEHKASEKVNEIKKEYFDFKED